MLWFQIWSSLDSGSFLRATQLFLLARHINTSLQLDSQQSARILRHFPVLSTQWAAIGHFRATILQVGCKSDDTSGLPYYRYYVKVMTLQGYHTVDIV